MAVAAIDRKRKPTKPRINPMLSLEDPALLREQCFIDGEWMSGATSIDILNPATGKLVARACQSWVPARRGEQSRVPMQPPRAGAPGRQRTAVGFCVDGAIS